MLAATTWWRHQVEAFSALLAICAGNSPVPGEFPTQRPVTRSFDVFFDLRLNKRLSKQSWCWWFETLSRPLWRQCNAILSSSVHGHMWVSVSHSPLDIMRGHLYYYHPMTSHMALAWRSQTTWPCPLPDDVPGQPICHNLLSSYWPPAGG